MLLKFCAEIMKSLNQGLWAATKTHWLRAIHSHCPRVTPVTPAGFLLHSHITPLTKASDNSSSCISPQEMGLHSQFNHFPLQKGFMSLNLLPLGAGELLGPWHVFVRVNSAPPVSSKKNYKSMSSVSITMDLHLPLVKFQMANCQLQQPGVIW